MADHRDNVVPVLPLKNAVLFPHLMKPLLAGRPATLTAIDIALTHPDKRIAVFTQRNAAVEEPGVDDLYEVGTLATIRTMARLEDTVHVVVQGLQRVAIAEVIHTSPYLAVRVVPIEDPRDHDVETEALHRSITELSERLADLVPPQVKANLEQMLVEPREPLQQAYLVASLLSLEPEHEMDLLTLTTRRDALRLVHDRLKHEVEILEIRQRIAREAESEIGREQREHVLRHQLKAIQKELGGARPPDEPDDIAKLRDQARRAGLPDVVKVEVERELTRLERTPPSSPDHHVARSWIELVVALPWSKGTKDNLDLARARRILDEDHHDLDDIKSRIVEHLAVMKLNPKAKAPILCFVGPPGVGKTSLGQSIARALGRHFERMSLGGMHDEAELRGHRRTYIGAMPGRIVRAMRRAAVNNPLLMLDEIDKLGRDFRGDPAGALMEILDPAQNVEFHDNYLDLPFDLSRVFFITTANSLDPVPRPVLDRMEVMHLSGYTDVEKQAIARRYLLPRQIEQAGLGADRLQVPDESLDRIVRRYTREAGVRELERSLGRVARKVAIRVAEGLEDAVIVAPEDLRGLLGAEKFFAESARRSLPPGVAAGLAWTEAGGDVIYVEAVLLPGSTELTLTGHLGTVMQESARAARSWVWARCAELGVDPERLKTGIHVHVPSGGTPKDGPSAGVTLVTALTSLLTGLPARSDTAMTGEITLTGLIMPVGGVKEKVLAAHRAGMKRVLLPRENAKDLEDLPPEVRATLSFETFDRVEELLAAVIPGLRPQLAPSTPRDPGGPAAAPA